MAYQAIPPIPLAGGGSINASAALARAQALLGSTITRVFGTDFDSSAWYATSNVGAGTAALSTTESGGLLAMASGATAAWVTRIRPAGSGVLLNNPTTSRWYLKSRFRFDTAVDSGGYITLAMIGTALAGPAFFFGAAGAISTANWSYDLYNNSNVSAGGAASSTAFTTATFYTVEMWGDTTNVRFAVDGTTLATVAIPAAMTSPVVPLIWVGNGGTAANRGLTADDIWFCCAPAP